MHVLIVVGHPRSDSLCGALAASFGEGARLANCEVETLRVGDLAFAPDVVEGSPAAQPLEPDLERARSPIAWADHLVLVYPNWWGTMPARFKGFLDRVGHSSIIGNACFFAESEPETPILWQPHNVASIVAKPPLVP